MFESGPSFPTTIFARFLAVLGEVAKNLCDFGYIGIIGRLLGSIIAPLRFYPSAWGY